MAPASPSSTRPFAPADLYRLRSVFDVTIHPNGSDVVFVVGWPDEESDSNRANLYRVGLDGNNHHRLTEGHRDSAPRFSPDGTKLAFARSAPGEPGKLMVLDWPLGDSRAVAEFKDGGPGTIQWLDNERLLVSAPQRPHCQQAMDDDELQRRPRVITSSGYRFNGSGYIHDRPNQVWLVSAVPVTGTKAEPKANNDGEDGAGETAAASGTSARPLGAVGVNHGHFAISPDGAMLVATAQLDDQNGLEGTNYLIRYDLTTAEDDVAGVIIEASDPTKLTSVSATWGTILWHPEAGPLVFGTDNTETIEFERMFRFDVDHPGKPDLAAFDDLNLLVNTSTTRTVAGGVLVTGIRNGRVGIDHYSAADGARSVVFEDDVSVVAFDTADDGKTIVAAITSPIRPAELWRISGGSATKLASLNDDVLAEIDLAVPEAVPVMSADGTTVEAFITRPPASAPDTGTPHPGLVYVHGGPMGQYGHFFFDEFQVAAAAGYVVIGGNPRGSDGYGQDWAQDVIANYGNRDWEDVQAITQFLVDQPDVDADRIGIGGGSYGGFMTTWALSHDDDGRYKAGLVERAVTDFVSLAGTSDIGTFFVKRYMHATIESDVEAIRRQSPLSYAHNITAPTLILHSEQDWRCPIEQAERLYTAICRNGGSAALVRFPGENHELSRNGQPKHRVERFEMVHEFYARHLGGADFGTSHFGAMSNGCTDER